MAAIAWPDVTALAPELATLGTDGQAIILDHVNTALSVSMFGGEDAPRTRLARIYLAAHYGTLSMQGGLATAGPVISQSLGDASRTYAQLATSSSAGLWSSTSYGQMYASLVRTSRARLPLVP